jgi:hypothetical protein
VVAFALADASTSTTTRRGPSPRAVSSAPSIGSSSPSTTGTITAPLDSAATSGQRSVTPRFANSAP